MYTIESLKEVTGAHEKTVIKHAKALYPELFINGKRTEFNDEQAYKIAEKLPKRNFISFTNMVSYLHKNVKVEGNDRIDRLEYMVEKLCGAVTMMISAKPAAPQLEMKQDYFTVLGYCRNKGIELTFSDAIRYGKECTKISNEAGIAKRHVDDERFGKVNSYHISALEPVSLRRLAGTERKGMAQRKENNDTNQ